MAASSIIGVFIGIIKKTVEGIKGILSEGLEDETDEPEMDTICGFGGNRHNRNSFDIFIKWLESSFQVSKRFGGLILPVFAGK